MIPDLCFVERQGSALVEKRRNSCKIEVYKARKKYKISQGDIIYMEAVDSSVEFVLRQGIFRKETSLNKLEKILERGRFFRISRNCIVNIAKIDRYRDNSIDIGGKIKKLSRRRKKEFEKLYNLHSMLDEPFGFMGF